mgnify:FL=1
METNGPFFTKTLAALALPSDQETDTRTNASNIVGAIINAYTGTEGAAIDPGSSITTPPLGLVYGRIQSGKTRAMIASTAMAFDNNFRIAVVMTSNINDLVTQTHGDFSSGLEGVMTFTKDNDLEKQAENAKLQLEIGDARILIVCSKGRESLQNVSNFLTSIGAEQYPSIIFDDEGDQASLDTNTRRRSRLPGAMVAPSAINDIIQNELRQALRKHVYVSVTGTPQAVLLQSAESTHRPSFIVMLPAGSAYTGGDHFFETDEPEENSRHLVCLVEQAETAQLIDETQPIPSGLRESLLFFLVSASAAILREGLPEKGYSYLCHPSLRNADQEIAEDRINHFLMEVTKVLHGTPSADTSINDGLNIAYAELQRTLGDETPQLEDIKAEILRQLPTRRLLVINAKVKRQGIDYGRGLNFLVGGNTLGRGIAIRDLLTTYYVRDSKVSQIDTMHQHARMYGYRGNTLPYTRVFLPRHLYYRFRDIHRSDHDLRGFVEEHMNTVPPAFPIEYSYDLRATRTGVLEAPKMSTLSPGMHVYPNHITLPQSAKSYRKVLDMVRNHLGFEGAETEEEIEEQGKQGLVINVQDAVTIAKTVKTGSHNTWRDKTIDAVIEKVAGRFGNQVILRFRTATRTVRETGYISTGTLSGDELTTAREESLPTLWVMSATTTPGSAVGAGEKFMYPTLVIPESLGSLFMFNRG